MTLTVMRPRARCTFILNRDDKMKTLVLLLLFHMVIAFPLVAGSRTSSSYLISTDSLDAGGHGASSANYSCIASIGGIAGISTAPVSEVVRHGYIGQLAEVTGVS